MNSPNVIRAEEGETVIIPVGWPAQVTSRPVAKPCGSTEGQWACSTHHLVFPNNLEASAHEDVDDGSHHVVVWLCYEHGPEGSK